MSTSSRPTRPRCTRAFRRTPLCRDALVALQRFDDDWGAQYPMIADARRARWEHIIPFLYLPAAVRRAVYTTNCIENLNRQIRKTIKTRDSFPDEQAATKLIYLAITSAQRS